MRTHLLLSAWILAGTLVHVPEDRPRPPCPLLPSPAVAMDTDFVFLSCQVTKRAEWMRGNATPIYPLLFARTGIGGLVQISFVVGSHGAIDSTTIIVFKSPHDSFTVAVRRAVATWRAHPAEFGAVRVRESGSHTFVFVPDSARSASPSLAPSADTTCIFATSRRSHAITTAPESFRQR